PPGRDRRVPDPLVDDGRDDETAAIEHEESGVLLQRDHRGEDLAEVRLGRGRLEGGRVAPRPPRDLEQAMYVPAHPGVGRHHPAEVRLGLEPLAEGGDVRGEYRPQRALEPRLHGGGDRPIGPEPDPGDEGQREQGPGPGGEATGWNTGEEGLASHLPVAYSTNMRSLEGATGRQARHRIRLYTGALIGRP